MSADVRHEALLAPPALGDARGEGRRRRGTAVAELPLEEAVHVGCHERAERVTAAAAHAPERLAVICTAMAAEAGRETRRGAESDEESDGCDGAQDSARVRVRNTY